MNSQTKHKNQKYRLSNKDNEKFQYGGTEPTIEELKAAFDNKFKEHDEKIQLLLKDLDVPIDDLLKKIIDECCPKIDCTQIVIDKVHEINEKWKVLLEEVSKEKSAKLTELINQKITEVKGLIADLKCPPTENK
ncbi:hypothetical protein Indivirus_1_174 [Indivirus ILV1]|uniref:Uncharacterized protein n=1 Tax=Indivirus ILV1 TaxID=1977633 RepID=A0A1V0SCY2_9VIRU|nr:hypothetical protein Indivirus_1_174 [Indivirus ILV1]